MPKIRSSQIQTFLNTGTALSPTYDLVGPGVVDEDINANPKETEEQWVTEDSARTSVDGYAATSEIEQTAISDDDVFEYIKGLWESRAILDDAETAIVNVDLYKTPALGEYYAEKQDVSISIQAIKRSGGVPVKIGYKINYLGDPVYGTFNPVTKVFTPNP